MHPLPQIDGCICTLRTCTDQDPAMPIWQPFYALFCPNLSFWCDADLMILKQTKSFALKKERWFWRLFYHYTVHCLLSRPSCSCSNQIEVSRDMKMENILLSIPSAPSIQQKQAIAQMFIELGYGRYTGSSISFRPIEN